MATDELSWKVNIALQDLDIKLNYFQHLKRAVKEKAREVAYGGVLVLGASGVIGGLLYGSVAGIAGIASVLSPDKGAEAYETNKPKNDSLEQKYGALAERVGAENGVDKRILLGLIAGGRTMYAEDLRKNGYAGIIPLKPEEAGVTAGTLNNDDEQCLMSAAQVFKKNAKKPAFDLESAVGCFWYREKDAEANKAVGGWCFISSAMDAANHRADMDWCAKRKETLQGHESALEFEKYLSTLPEEERKWKMANSYSILMRKINSPASIFCCKASIEAFERNEAGDKFTWIDLLPVKLASAIYCSLAYMNGVKFKPENGSGG